MKLRQIMEMATLKGWHPSRNTEWIVRGKWIDGTEFDDVFIAGSAEEAIQQAVEDVPDLDVHSLTATLSEYEKDEKESGFFDNLTQNDIQSINSDKTAKQIEKWLNDNNTPYEWIIYFNPKNSIPPTPGAITFVKHGNIGGHILSPHMILHTAGHAIVGYDATLPKALEEFAHFISNDKLEDKQILTICKFLHMQAAKSTLKGNNKWAFPTMNEVVYEMLGIYIKNGRVKFEPNEYCDIDVDQNVIQYMRDIINNYCKLKLDSVVGRVVIDSY